MEPILKTEHVKVIYNQGKDNEYIALNDISLEIYPNEYVIFFGPSGCGKSTMLYTLLGLQKAASGKVLVNGQDSARFTEADRNRIASSFFGIIFQNFNLIYSLNVADNVALPQVFINIPRKARKERAQQLMERFGIAMRARNLPNNLSGGQQQRVAISRALINDPKILLADEPVGNLDSESARVVMQTLSEINRQDEKTVILVTHDPSYLPFANRVYFFKDAKLERVQVNEKPLMPDEVLAKPAQKEISKSFSFQNLEKMARVRKSVTLPELKAWILTQYLTEEMTSDQTERLEGNMADLLEGRVNLGEFESLLQQPYSKGGVGLYTATAREYSRKVSEIIRLVGEAKEISFSGNHEQRRSMVHLLRKFVMEEYSGDITRSQITHLEKCITARINQEINNKEMVELLTRPVTEGGAHLRINSATHIAERLEIILAAIQKDYESR